MVFKYCLLCIFLPNIISSQKNIINDLKETTQDDTFGLLLQEIMVRTLQPYKSIMIFTDELYSDLFQMKWFKRFGIAISYIRVKVNDSDDLYAPESEIKDSLKLAKLGGCQLYIFLIANGIQMRRLLQFGDKYRTLDTLSKFILLYDNRLFDKKLLYLWKRIINVVFIRKHESYDINTKDNSWFEITTVPFPFPIKNILIPRRLDIWAQSKFRKGYDLFRDKTVDLQNETLKVVAFPHVPAIEKINVTDKRILRSVMSKTELNETINFSGTEIEILQTISSWMNFRCEIYEPDDIQEELWGRKGVGGLYTGLLGELVSTKADIALGDFYYTPYFLDLIDLTVPYNTECLTFLTPEALTDNSWKTLILPFEPIMWVSVLISLIICILAFHYLARFHVKIGNENTITEEDSNKSTPISRYKKVMTLSLYPACEKLSANKKYSLMKEKYQVIKKEGEPIGLYQFQEPVNCTLYTYSMLLLVSLPKLPTGWSLRVLTGWYWLYCLLVVTSYRASMTAILARPTPKVKIDTVEELVASKLTYGGWGEVNRDFFKTSSDPAITMIAENFVIVNDSESAVDRVADASFAFYENTYFLQEALVKRQLRYQNKFLSNENSTKNDKLILENIKGDRTLHIMDNCIINMPISIGLQKNSPLKPRLDKYIRRVLEAGFIKKWLDDVMQKVRNAEIQIEDVGNSKALMNTKKFSGALIALFCGYFLSTVTFISEIIYFYIKIARNPNFNKYSKTIVIKTAK